MMVPTEVGNRIVVVETGVTVCCGALGTAQADCRSAARVARELAPCRIAAGCCARSAGTWVLEPVVAVREAHKLPPTVALGAQPGRGKNY